MKLRLSQARFTLSMLAVGCGPMLEQEGEDSSRARRCGVTP
jgi:hypothetical protein